MARTKKAETVDSRLVGKMIPDDFLTIDMLKGMAGDQVRQLNIEITFVDEFLGTSPADKEIYSRYIANQISEKTRKEEIEALGGAEEYEGQMITIFNKDKETGNPFIYNYLIKGLFKNACNALAKIPNSDSSNFKAYKKKIDGLIFTFPRRLEIECAGPITICQRPLRAQTAQGERIALAASECVPAGSKIRCTIVCLTEEITNLTIQWLNYGALNGLGQWHNSGMGRFIWREISAEEVLGRDESIPKELVESAK